MIGKSCFPILDKISAELSEGECAWRVPTPYRLVLVLFVSGEFPAIGPQSVPSWKSPSTLCTKAAKPLSFPLDAKRK